jgi:type IV pilus assembly protein PilB
MPAMGESLGQELVAEGLLTEEQLTEALRVQSEIGGGISQILVKLRYVKEEEILARVAKREGLEVIKSEDVKVDTEIMAKLPQDLVEKHEIVPLSHTATHLKVGLPDVSDLPAIEEVRFLTGLEVQAALITSADASAAIGRHYGKSEAAPARARPKRDIHAIAREVGGIPTAADASRAVAEIDASPAKLVKGLAALLVDKRIISAADLKAWVKRLG